MMRRVVLPERPARGRLIVPENVVKRTRTILQAARGVDGRHEGIALWAGRVVEDDSYVLSVIRPKSVHGRGYVRIDELAVGEAAEAARALFLGMIAQVHSHPGWGTEHSDGDDELVLMPFEGMFSLVVGRYGRGSMDPNEGAGMHQFQDGRWVKMSPTSRSFVVVPAEIPVND